MTASNQVGKRAQPSWSAPVGGVVTGLKLHNSLTRKKESFIPSKGKRVYWYTCGPTVYDDSHMGHARSYISFDIMRRILKDYFKYEVFYVMNITDVDDKIIRRARRNYLFEEYAKKGKSIDEIIQDAQPSIQLLSNKLSSDLNEDKRNMYARMLGKIKNAVDNKSSYTREALLDEMKDVMSDWLDEKEGSTVSENSIFLDLPKRYEERFHEDMKSLNVLFPNDLTRVSEYIPEIIDFIKKIIDHGYGYASNGSVYFDTAKFDQSPNHFYAKLVPEAFGDTCALEEGEGDLSVSEDRLKEKRNVTDFALWKASKSGEPSWDSEWGKGRPGWHIECSAMASHIFGDSLDIHTGGVDLKFPHHDNELAQSEAYFDNNEWVKYFLHSGHLTIAGCKMSKSLKNFITIKDALQKYSAVQLRLLFLLHGWSSTLDYSSSTMEIATSYEKKLNEFFGTVKDILWKQKNDMEAAKKRTEKEDNLREIFHSHKEKVHDRLCDNLDTRGALEVISQLISSANVYVESKRKSRQLPNKMLMKDIAVYITELFRIFGAYEMADSIGPPESKSQSNNDEQELEYLGVVSTFMEKVKVEALKEKDGDVLKLCDELKGNVLPSLRVQNEEQKFDCMDALSSFREKVKVEALKKKYGDVLKLCDELRDDVLPFLGVQLGDVEGEETIIKFVDKEVLLKEREARLEREKQKQLKKEMALAQQKAKLEAGKMPPSEMFRSEAALYSSFDEKGIPTHDATGEPLTKSQLKKLQKAYDVQAKKHTEYLKVVKNGFDVMEN